MLYEVAPIGRYDDDDNEDDDNDDENDDEDDDDEDARIFVIEL